MTTVYAIRDGQVRYDTIERSQVAKRIKILRREGWSDVRVIPVDKPLTARQ